MSYLKAFAEWFKSLFLTLKGTIVWIFVIISAILLWFPFLGNKVLLSVALVGLVFSVISYFTKDESKCKK